jgi:hypothetical protein
MTRPYSQSFPAARQFIHMRRRASSKAILPAQTARARQASVWSFSPASSHGCNSRFRGSDGAPPSANGTRWSSSKSTRSSSGISSSWMSRRFAALVYETGGRIVFVHPGTQIVWPIVVCVTAGFSGSSCAASIVVAATASKARIPAKSRETNVISICQFEVPSIRAPLRRVSRLPRRRHLAPRGCIALSAGFRICARYQPTPRTGHLAHGSRGLRDNRSRYKQALSSRTKRRAQTTREKGPA